MKVQGIMPADRGAPRRRCFTLVELMIIMAMLGILAAIVVPYYQDNTDRARTEVLATNVTHVRTLIIQHSSDGSVSLSAAGYPTAIPAGWFKTGQLPEHAWSDRPMVVEIVSGPSNAVYPAVKTFDPSAVGAFSAWYNDANGSFCARVPVMSSNAITLETFNGVNKCSAGNLAQITR